MSAPRPPQARAPEFSRPVRVDQLGAGRDVTIAADADERRRLAGRFGLLAVASLTASFTLRPAAGGVVAEGRVAAEVTQACAGSGEPLAASVDEAVALRFLPEGVADEAEVELAADALDTLPLVDGVVDLGEAAAETMALALDPFARGPDAAAALAAAGVTSEAAAPGSAAFAGLAALRDALEPGD